MKLLRLLLTAVLAGCVLPVNAQGYDTHADGVYYKLNISNMTAGVSMIKPEENVGKIIIPDTIRWNGIPFAVTSLSDSDILQNDLLVSLVINDKISEVLECGGSNLEYLHIGSGITTIKHVNTGKMRTFIIPDNVEKTAYCCAINGNTGNTILEHLVIGKSFKDYYLERGGGTSDYRMVCGPNLKDATILSKDVYIPSNIYDSTHNPFFTYVNTKFSTIFVLDSISAKKTASGYANTFRNLCYVKGAKKEFVYSGATPNIEIGINNPIFTAKAMSGNNINVGTYSSMPVHLQCEEYETDVEFPYVYSITPAPLNLIANNVRRKYLEDNPDLTFRSEGFVAGENESVLSAQPVLITNAEISSKPGEYPIDIKDAAASNYTITYYNGKLIIDKADQTISWSQDLTSIVIGDQKELTASVPSGASVSYESSDESIARIITIGGKSYIQGLTPGTVTIYASQNGNDCYNAAPTIEREIEIKPLLVSSINLNLTNLSLNIGGSVSLYATVTPTNATNPAVTWSSSDEKVLTVDNGEVQAVGVGKAVITATTTDGSDLSASCNITVKPILATDLSLSNNSLTIEEGGADIIIATISPANATAKALLWTSSNEKVATVSDGVVTAVGQGVAIITATTTDGTNLSVQCKVTVTPSTKTPITLNQTEATMKANDVLTLVASLEGKALSSSELTWRSSNESVASVVNGIVTAKSVGETTIVGTMTDGSNRSAMCRVVVDPTLVENVQMNINEVGLEVGMTLNLTATVLPETATNKTLSWVSSNEAVASVTQTGTVVALAEGATNITVSATDGSKAKATCMVIVGNPDAITLINCYKEQGARVYDMTGRLLESPMKGINIIKMPNGTTKKVLMR